MYFEFCTVFLFHSNFHWALSYAIVKPPRLVNNVLSSLTPSIQRADVSPRHNVQPLVTIFPGSPWLICLYKCQAVPYFPIQLFSSTNVIVYFHHFIYKCDCSLPIFHLKITTQSMRIVYFQHFIYKCNAVLYFSVQLLSLQPTFHLQMWSSTSTISSTNHYWEWDGKNRSWLSHALD